MNSNANLTAQDSHESQRFDLEEKILFKKEISYQWLFSKAFIPEVVKELFRYGIHFGVNRTLAKISNWLNCRTDI